MTKLPKDFTITEAHRIYCEKTFGLPYLADALLSAFKDVFDEELGGNGTKHKNWNLTLYKFLRNTAPGGRFYNAVYWEEKRNAAKRLQFGDRTRRTPQYDPRGAQPEKPAEKHVVDAAMSKLRGMLSGI